MEIDVLNIISELSELKAPSGFEMLAAERAAEMMAKLGFTVRTDALGNVIGEKLCGKPGAKKLLFDAHIDEIGLIVTGYDGGFLRFATLGGVDKRLLPALEVSVLAPGGAVPGIVTCMPPHILPPDASDKAFKELRIDTGMTDEEAKEKIPLGTPVTFMTKCRRLGKNALAGKSLDDRSCLAVILDAAARLAGKELAVDLYIMASTQEELGCRGAKAGVFSVNPDYAVAVDVTHAYTPDAKKEETLAFGGGAAIGVGPNMNRKLTETLVSLAKKNEIKYQLEVMAGNTGTNAWVMQTSREGVCTAVVSLPLKYMHTPEEVISLADIEPVTALLTELAFSMGKEDAE